MSIPTASLAKNRQYKWVLAGILLLLVGVLAFMLFRDVKEKFVNQPPTSGSLYCIVLKGAEKTDASGKKTSKAYSLMDEFLPETEKLGAMIEKDNSSTEYKKKKKSVEFSVLNGASSENFPIMEKNGVKCFPAVVLEYGGKSYLYSGDMTAEEIYNWQNAITNSVVTTLDKPKAAPTAPAANKKE